MPPTPAKWAKSVLAVVAELVAVHGEWPYRLIDPFAGPGLGALGDALGAGPDDELVGVELEEEWAAGDPRTVVGDACALPDEWTGRFDLLVSSPAFGNRMSDHHEATDASERNTYRHKLGRPLSPNNAGGIPWAKRYRALHETAWWEAHRVLRPGALIVVNVSNFLILDVEQRVVEFHLNTWLLPRVRA